jgi:hypothetical protein
LHSELPHTDPAGRIASAWRRQIDVQKHSA